MNRSGVADVMLTSDPGVTDMKVLSLACNHCGAPLEVRAKTRFATCQFCDAKLAIHQDGSAAYTEVLEEINERTGKIENRLANIEIQNDVARIDREWEQEREGYYIQGKHGRRHLPSKAGSVAMSIVMAGFGIFWTTMASAVHGPMALFGVVFIGVAIVSGVWGFTKATQYESGRRAYERRRMSALAGEMDQDLWTDPASES
jgi:hypothetical protein